MEIHIHIHHHCEGCDQLDLIIKNTNKIIMTQAEAAAKLTDLTTQVGKVSTEVKALIDLIQSQGNVSPEVEAAITSLQTAIQGVDDLNADA